EPECTVTPSSAFAVRLVEIGGGEGACAVDAAADPFNARLKAPLTGGEFGLRPFVGLGADLYPDYAAPQKVAVQFLDMGALQLAAGERLGAAYDADLPVYAMGQFASATAQNEICSIPSFEPARLTIPAIPARPADPGDPDDEEDDDPGAPAQPAVDITAAWSNMRVLVTAAYPGTQFEATLTYTVNGCARTYLATGVFGGFGVYCAVLDDDGHPTGEVDPALCDPTITAINPDFPVVCDEATALCLLDGPFGTGAR
ncbi:MAG TPA: hypothetical protein VFS00_28625, partial [Polyangiaceae bacterium]|nr:hypothetical protein [Polyangiaceae bacterium]